MEQEKKSAAEVEKEGAKVTGGAASADQKASAETSPEGSKAHSTGEASKKEDMTGYNELPEQSKVGGG